MSVNAATLVENSRIPDFLSSRVLASAAKLVEGGPAECLPALSDVYGGGGHASAGALERIDHSVLPFFR